MKMAVQFLVLACFLALFSDQSLAAPFEPQPLPPAKPHPAGPTFFDQIFNIPSSIIASVNKDLNAKNAKCPDGSLPVKVEGKGTCHDHALGIAQASLSSVNQFLNG